MFFLLVKRVNPRHYVLFLFYALTDKYRTESSFLSLFGSGFFRLLLFICSVSIVFFYGLEEMLRAILRAATADSRTAPDRSIPAVIVSSKLSSSNYSSSTSTKSSLTKAKKSKQKAAAQSEEASAAAADDDFSDPLGDEAARNRRLAEDDKDPSLDVGPNGRALFTSATAISQLSRKDACAYMKFRYSRTNLFLPLCVVRLVL